MSESTAIRSKMVHFVLTRQGYDQLIQLCGDQLPSPLWVNAGVLSPSELADLRSQGLDVTDFTQQIPTSGQEFYSAIDIIKEHHPDVSVWVEYPVER